MANTSKPNVLFLLTDDQRYGTIHALGNPEIQTPNIDKLVHDGTSFLNAHIPGGTVSAVCMPSRAMIKSGKTLFHLECDGQNIPECDITMGENFLRNGYNSFSSGKWHNGVESFKRSFNGGANIFFGGMWDHWNVPVSDFRADGNYDNKIMFTPNFSANCTAVPVIADRINAGIHSTDLFSAAVVDYIKNYDDDKPFFAYLAFLAPHDPRTMPDKYKNMYDPEKITLPENFSPTPPFSFGWAGGRDETMEAYPRKPESVRKHIADYYAMISHIDECIGNVVNALKEKGMYENTIIVLAGDNGLAVGQHGLMGKQNVYEHSVKLPLVMCGPGIPKDVRNDKYVYLLDIYPTLCDLCGIDIPSSVDGLSFAKMFSDDEYISRKDLYLAFQARIRGIMDGKYKLIEYRTDKLKLTQLFDLENDPMEMANLFDIDGYESITNRLRERLFELRDEWGDKSTLAGRQFWQQYDLYEKARLEGVAHPKGSNFFSMTKEWGNK